MATDKRSWNARLTADTYARLHALAEHFSTIRAPTTLTAVVEQAITELAARILGAHTWRTLGAHLARTFYNGTGC